MSSSPPLVVADRYRLVAPLGQGGMGRVWRATDVVLHREVAIKELVPPPGLTPGERQEMRERSLREARAIARLNNINVVRVFDVLSTDADPWIVMEYVPSRSLQDTLAQDGPFNALRTAEIGLGVLNALRAAHRNGVVHRDVKPGNVLLGADGRVVLTDFGLATVPGDPNVTRTGLVLGSPAYIAPERARDGTAGPAADLWSLGATLYAAVEGQSPFARPSAIATLAALATENVPVARNAGPLKPVLNGLLRKDPAHRINAEEAERLLARAAGRRSKITFPMSPTMRRPGVGRERPSLPSGPGGPPVLPGSGWVAATGSAPVVPTPRPPAAGQPPVDGRPPHYAPGKAQVGGQQPPPAPPRRTPKPLDATRLDTPPVKDDGKPVSGTRQAPPTAPRGGHGRGAVPPGPAAADVPPSVANSAAPTNALRTGFTAADVAANRRKKAAPEHESSLAQATSGYPVVTPRTAPAKPDDAQATKVVPPTGPEAQATKVVPPTGAEAQATKVVPQTAEAQATTVMPAAEAQATTVVPPAVAKPSATTSSTTTPSAGASTGTTPAKATPAGTTSAATTPPGATPPGTTPSEAGPSEVRSSGATLPGVTPVSDEPSGTEPADDRTAGSPPPETGPAGDKATDSEPEKAAVGNSATGAAAGRPSTGEPAEMQGTPVPGDSAAAEPTTPGATVDRPETGAAEPSAIAANKPSAIAANEPGAVAANEPGAVAAKSVTDSGPDALGSIPAVSAAPGNAPIVPGAPEDDAPGNTPAASEAPGSTSAEPGRPGSAAPESSVPVTEDAGDEPAEPRPEASTEAGRSSIAAGAKPGPEGSSASEDRTSVVALPVRAAGPARPTRAADGPADDKTSLLTPGDDKTSLLTPGDDKTSLLRPGDDKTSLLRPPDEKTSLLSPAPLDERTTLLGGDDRTSVVNVPPRRRRTIQVPGSEPRRPGDLEVEPGFTRPSRPAWTPIQMRPVERRPGGITILGTTLTRRQAAIGLGIVLTFLLLVGIIVVQAFGGDDDGGDPDVTKAGTAASAPAQADGGKKDDPGKKPQDRASSPATPSSPAASSSPAGGGVPAGWRVHRGSGYSMPVPDDARASGGGTATTLEWGAGRQFRIDVVPGTTDPLQYLKSDGTVGSNRISGPTVVDFHGRAAEVEYYRSTGGGTQQHVVRRVLNSGNRTLVLTWYTESDDWDAAKTDLAAIYGGFKTD